MWARILLIFGLIGAANADASSIPGPSRAEINAASATAPSLVDAAARNASLRARGWAGWRTFPTEPLELWTPESAYRSAIAADALVNFAAFGPKMALDDIVKPDRTGGESAWTRRNAAALPTPHAPVLATLIAFLATVAALALGRRRNI